MKIKNTEVLKVCKSILFKAKIKKVAFLFLIGIFFISACQNVSVNSQTKTQINQNMKEIKSLKDFQWKKRIILVKESDKKVLKQLRKEKDEINERHIVWFCIEDKNIETNYKGNLSKDFVENLKNNYFEKFDINTFLIGKDGGIKSKDKKLNLKNYFEQIDSMPMRQQEMRENQ